MIRSIAEALAGAVIAISFVCLITHLFPSVFEPITLRGFQP